MAKTALVLGAGASAPYGFPSGQRLCDIIKVDLNPTKDKLDRMGIGKRSYDVFRLQLQSAGRISVDAFLESRPDLIDQGRLAIALALLPCEKEDRLFNDWSQGRLELKGRTKPESGHWYELLFNMLTQGRSFVEVDLAGLGVVTFNYDRSFEHYFFTALKHSYDKTDAEVREKLSAARIIHVHGSLGLLPWQSDPEDARVVGYGHETPTDVLCARESIKVLHEADESSPAFQQARKLIASADRVFFFGFGFHRMNLLRLGMADMEPNGSVGGTARHLSYDTVTKSKAFQFFNKHPIRNSPRWQDKDIYDYLYDHVTFDT